MIPRNFISSIAVMLMLLIDMVSSELCITLFFCLKIMTCVLFTLRDNRFAQNHVNNEFKQEFVSWIKLSRYFPEARRLVSSANSMLVMLKLFGRSFIYIKNSIVPRLYNIRLVRLHFYAYFKGIV